MPFGVPECDYIPSLRMFRVRKAIGKHFTSGGFGMTLAVEEEEETTLCSNCSTPTTAQHLFVEEALFLFERGVLDVYDNNGTKLGAQQIYDMLEPNGICLPIYLTFAHLRAQDYRVLRHVDNDDSNTNKQSHEMTTSNNNAPTSIAAMKKARQTVVLQTLNENPTAIVFDVYQPNTLFRKTNPGIPEMVVAVARFSLPSPTFGEIQQTISTLCCAPNTDVPLKIATVSDCGVVIMFGVSTRDGVPDIVPPNRNAQVKK